MTNSNPSAHLSQVEFALLQLLSESSQLSGYQVNRLIEERGYREWADIGATSIYVGLDKLFKKGLAEFDIPTHKHGKGPLPKNYSLTSKGQKVLNTEVLAALSTTREHDRRFDLALAASTHLGTEEVLLALTQRKTFLLSEKDRINRQFMNQGGLNLPGHVRLLFRHTLIHLEAELGFTDETISTFKVPQEMHLDHSQF